MSVRLHIEHLLVDGVELGAGGALELKDAMRSRLAQLLSEPRIFQGAAPDLHEARVGNGAAALGEHAATAVRASLPAHYPGAGQ